jgi:Ca2+-binding RTX toxin-like protein
LLNAAAGYGYAGNDVFVANSTGNYNFNGGSGHDTYVIGDAQAIDYYNINFTLSGPVNEIADYLYLDLLGRNIATSVEGDDLVLQIGSTRGVAAVRVQNWYSSTLNYQLDRIAQIHPGTNTQWSLTYYDYKELGIPLFLTGTTQIDIIYGSMTDDSDMRGLGGNDKIYGRDGNDTIYGDYGWDVPYLEEGGWDVIYGGNGNDTLYAEGGSGELYGEAGHDTLWGGSGSDSLFGGEGTDSLYGSQGRDFLEGGEGNDILFGDEPGLAEALSGNDELYGGAGDDVLYGHYGNDELSGEEGGDTLYGGNGYDTLYGGIGNDKLNGDGGNDILFGGGGLNRLRGGADDDYLISISPIDDLDGGGGNDTYRLESKGNYTIQETGYGSDRLILYFFSTSLPTFNVSGADLIIAFADGNQQIIEDMSTVGSQVETLEIYASFMLNGTAYEKHNTYNLFMAWNAALQGDASGGSALISSTNFVPTGFNLAADGDDVLIGSDAADELRGYGGNDTIDGRGGNDRLFGDEGNDTFNISGNSGVDTVNGGSGPDTLNLDWSSNTSANWLAFSIQKADASWQHFGYYHGDNGSYSGDAVSPSIDGVRPQFYDNLKKQMDIIPIF